MKPRGGTSYRLSEEAQGLLNELAGLLGISKTGVLEIAIRKLAKLELGDGCRTAEYTPARRGRPRRIADPPLRGAN